MKPYVVIPIALLLLTCSGKDKAPTEPGPAPSTGTTRTFTVNYGYCSCTEENKVSQSNADRFCISLGYEYATDIKFKSACQCGITTMYGNWMTQVTCWKP